MHPLQLTDCGKTSLFLRPRTNVQKRFATDIFSPPSVRVSTKAFEIFFIFRQKFFFSFEPICLTAKCEEFLGRGLTPNFRLAKIVQLQLEFSGGRFFKPKLAPTEKVRTNRKILPSQSCIVGA
jgi:hypothetical protein